MWPRGVPRLGRGVLQGAAILGWGGNVFVFPPLRKQDGHEYFQIVSGDVGSIVNMRLGARVAQVGARKGPQVECIRKGRCDLGKDFPNSGPQAHFPSMRELAKFLWSQ